MRSSASAVAAITHVLDGGTADLRADGARLGGSALVGDGALLCDGTRVGSSARVGARPARGGRHDGSEERHDGHDKDAGVHS